MQKSLDVGTNAGERWGAKTTLFTPPGGAHDYRDPVIFKTATNRILLNFFDYQGSPPELDDLYVCHSDDGGTTWSSPVTLNQYTGYTCGSGTILQHSSGPILMTFYGLNSGETFPPSRIGVTRSTDDGATWSAGISMGAGAQPSGETCLIELANGTIRAYTRQDITNPGPIYYADSTDVGLTWGSWTALGWNTTPGRPAAFRTADNGFVTLFYRKSVGGGMCYRVSADGITFGSEVVVNASSSMYAGPARVTALHRDSVGYLFAVENSSSDCKVLFVKTDSS